MYFREVIWEPEDSSDSDWEREKEAPVELSRTGSKALGGGSDSALESKEPLERPPRALREESTCSTKASRSPDVGYAQWLCPETWAHGTREKTDVESKQPFAECWIQPSPSDESSDEPESESFKGSPSVKSRHDPVGAGPHEMFNKLSDGRRAAISFLTVEGGGKRVQQAFQAQVGPGKPAQLAEPGPDDMMTGTSSDVEDEPAAMPALRRSRRHCENKEPQLKDGGMVSSESELCPRAAERTEVLRVRRLGKGLKKRQRALKEPSKWVSDAELNDFTEMVNSRSREYFQRHDSSCGLKRWLRDESGKYSKDEVPEERVPTFVMNSHFLVAFNAHGYGSVERWTNRQMEGKVLDYGLILVPVNRAEFHWSLVGVDLRKREFFFLDTKRWRDTEDSLTSLRKWLVAEVTAKYSASLVEKLAIETWSAVKNPEYTPTQVDSSSCGVFVAFLADYLERGKRPRFGHGQVKALREKMAGHLKLESSYYA